ncbi:hypothetical protein D8674_030418 [Pyrus ussuriensis x Pyrus communis]|uniref:Uncharacterized protein n=1 Tax=Pyrus ussuriensis x Pyrus communis TaxID=2448454 RepID=A0A5N5EVE7_9ROSA|nr:hypothetical protein D8674_030418 [Pyrus ussuriensis x Pyrus communis]
MEAFIKVDVVEKPDDSGGCAGGDQSHLYQQLNLPRRNWRRLCPLCRFCPLRRFSTPADWSCGFGSRWSNRSGMKGKYRYDKKFDEIFSFGVRGRTEMVVQFPTNLTVKNCKLFNGRFNHDVPKPEGSANKDETERAEPLEDTVVVITTGFSHARTKFELLHNAIHRSRS